ncbi:hypothetical protein HQQ88_06715 [Curtobacterium sp. VKM Ac-2861]|uniref:hypothetical protein n=1 Tax=unclassified Curtobacterium TaxID=257496 RepID=UPI001065E9B1|nr:hypothetical protein [Curtobacterium sp. PhB25]NQW89985.1 hypothetical protein [Curtobacterium sp. VKM Ac-2861]TDW72749.1 hypothetical protein EDF51_103209 [Curtobacterium sp. PhB25]
MIDPATLPELPRLLSAPRFDRYAARYGGRADLGSRLYAWNCEIAAAFWGPVGCLEVFVRNALHDQLRRSRRDDWWNDPTVRLLERERRAVTDATRTLVRRGVSDPEPDQIVAATSFGFWVGLTDAGVPRDPLWSYETTLWQPRLVHAFPRLGQVRRKQLHRRLDDVRRFRNRLAHHEPVHAAPLERIRDDIVAIAGYVDHDAAAFIAGAQRIDAVIARKRIAVSSGASVI